MGKGRGVIALAAIFSVGAIGLQHLHERQVAFNEVYNTAMPPSTRPGLYNRLNDRFVLCNEKFSDEKLARLCQDDAAVQYFKDDKNAQIIARAVINSTVDRKILEHVGTSEQLEKAVQNVVSEINNRSLSGPN